MPIYEYICVKCLANKEVRVNKYGIGEEDTLCPSCTTPMKRIPSLPAKTTVGKYGKGGG